MNFLKLFYFNKNKTLKRSRTTFHDFSFEIVLNDKKTYFRSYNAETEKSKVKNCFNLVQSLLNKIQIMANEKQGNKTKESCVDLLLKVP